MQFLSKLRRLHIHCAQVVGDDSLRLHELCARLCTYLARTPVLSQSKIASISGQMDACAALELVLAVLRWTSQQNAGVARGFAPDTELGH